MRVERHWRPYSAWNGAGPVLHLPFYKYGSEQTKILDISGNNNHGIITGAVPNPGISLRVAQSAMKISAGAGIAFVDFGVAGALSQSGRRVIIRDSSGKQIAGCIGEAGTGQTLGDELVTNGTFTDDSNWNKGTGWTIHDGKAYADGTGIGANLTNNNSITQGLLVKGSVDVVKNSGWLQFYPVFASGNNYQLINSTGTFTKYIVCDSSSNRVTIFKSWPTEALVFNGTIDNVSVKQVLTPSVTGCLITSTPGGAVQSWESQDSGFNYNDSGGYTVYLEGDPCIGWYFDGVDDKCVVADLGAITGAFTSLVWMRNFDLGTTASAVLVHGQTSYKWITGYNIGPTGYRDYVRTASGPVYTTVSASVDPSKFHLFATTYDKSLSSSRLKSFFDGSLVAAVDGYNEDVAGVGDQLHVGFGGGSFVYSNIVAGDVEVFNRTLAAEEIRSYYDRTREIYG